MVALRVLAALAVAGIGASLVAYIFTLDRRCLRYGWRVLQYAVGVALVLLALLGLERLAVV